MIDTTLMSVGSTKPGHCVKQLARVGAFYSQPAETPEVTCPNQKIVQHVIRKTAICHFYTSIFFTD